MAWFFDPLRPCGYNVILADPPTRWASYSPFESAKAPPYATMDDAWLRQLPVENLAAADCLLVLWSTFPKLALSMELIEHWGFRYITGGSWHKLTVNGKTHYGPGKVLQSGAEPFLLARRGRPKYVKRPVKGVFSTVEEDDAWLIDEFQTSVDAVKREHSRKPDEQYERIEKLMGDVPRCELFSQTTAPGWDVWGDQTDKYKLGES